MGKMIRIQVTVEPRVYQPTTEILEVDAAEVEGLGSQEREAYLASIAEEYANEQLPWGWEELDGES